MAEPIGFIKCTEPDCQEVAEVRKAGGKRQSLYTWCPDCGTNQANGEKRQKYLVDNLKASREEVEKGSVSDTEETGAIPTQNAALSVSEDTDNKPKPIPENKPKGSAASPPVLLGALALIAAVVTAIFATRKPTNKHKGQTA
ncbi:hypothetical protein [Marinomonas algicola]|uniref:hypothetical protein n=1 Tax=Marinomonas algicola TaxID=2773454 RepID=UPI00174AC7E3|nr:hypothetical protein [Marinomonas algicola]